MLVRAITVVGVLGCLAAGSFTLAAKDLFLTQSAVSHAIKALEDDLGTRLLDRVGRRVMLTQSGEQFLRHTEKILREMEAARGDK